MDAKGVLIDRAALDLIKFASEDETRCEITGLHVTPAHVEATNGHVAARLTHQGIPVEDFPVVAGDVGGALPKNGVVVNRGAVEKIAKAISKRGRIPILQLVKVGAVDGGACLVATDLETPTVMTIKDEGRLFPIIDNVIPKEGSRPVKVAFQAKYLKAIAEWAIKHGRSGAVEIELSATPEDEAASIKVKMDDGRTLQVVLMPMKP